MGESPCPNPNIRKWQYQLRASHILVHFDSTSQRALPRSTSTVFQLQTVKLRLLIFDKSTIGQFKASSCQNGQYSNPQSGVWSLESQIADAALSITASRDLRQVHPVCLKSMDQVVDRPLGSRSRSSQPSASG